MIFELGKYYKHTCGCVMKVVARANTTLYGECLLAESERGEYFSPIGETEDHSINWEEISEEEYKKLFKKEKIITTATCSSVEGGE